MGAAASIQPEVFALAKDEYEAKKGEGLSDEDLFNHMKTFITEKTAEMEKKQPEEVVASGEATAETTVESTAASAETADAPPSTDLENMAPTAGDEGSGTSSG